MFIDNSIIVLIVIQSNKDANGITPYKRLQELLPIEKSHISQALAQNERNGLIKKPDSSKYFTRMQITLEGIQKAKRYIAFLSKILNIIISSI